MGIFILILVASGIVGILVLTLGWPIMAGVVASGTAVVSYILFYLVGFFAVRMVTSNRSVVGRFMRKLTTRTLFILFVLEVVAAAAATLITKFVCKYDLYHTLTLIAPCLMGAKMLGSGAAESKKEENGSNE